MNKRLFAAFLALGLTAQTPPNLGARPASAVITYTPPVSAIEHDRVNDGTGARARADHTVVTSRGKIAAAGPASSTSLPKDAKVIDGRGYTLTPGFVGTHDHLYSSSGGPL